LAHGTECGGNCAICLDAKTVMWNATHFKPVRRDAQSSAVEIARKIVFTAAATNGRWPCAAGRRTLNCSMGFYLHSESFKCWPLQSVAEPMEGHRNRPRRWKRLFGIAGRRLRSQELSSRGIYAERFGIRIPKYPNAAKDVRNAVLARAHAGRHRERTDRRMRKPKKQN